MLLGAGRERKGDPIDLGVGIVLEAKVGDAVRRGEPIAVLHATDPHRLATAQMALREGVTVAPEPLEPRPLILDRLGF
jgi:thymidine phosphorylase